LRTHKFSLIWISKTIYFKQESKLKKLKISGKQVRRIGYSGEECIRIALQTVAGCFRRDQKEEALEWLQKVLIQPGNYVRDPVWKSLADCLLVKPDTSRHPVRWRQQALDFRVFGRDGIDDETLGQMQTAMKLPVATDGALMPDAHVGYGLPIGGVLAAYNAVIPYGVGMDIGCRMCMSIFSLPPETIDKDRNRLKNILISETRFGNAAFSDVGEHELFERSEFREISFLRGLKKTFIEQLGSSGHGNHFVDMGVFQLAQPTPYLSLAPGKYLAVLSHSGSRNFGAEVCKHYTRVAQDKLGLSGESGRLAWLDLTEEEGQEYWLAMQLAGDYSRANHHFLHDRIARALAENPLIRIENHHNFAWKEQLPDGRELIIHRKGATPAARGDVGIIPGTMASPAYIVAGKGNEASLHSAAHGAGRAISRTRAKALFKSSELDAYLRQQGVELIGGGTDEAPQAYKDIHQVMKSQSDLVETLGLFFPRIVRME
jgi:tRNA-splicing ligase RtcB (3'-phosphate/5'-hydroxy nucleic acid ligase)